VSRRSRSPGSTDDRRHLGERRSPRHDATADQPRREAKLARFWNERLEALKRDLEHREGGKHETDDRSNDPAGKAVHIPDESNNRRTT
jgi:hypothetical protein